MATISFKDIFAPSFWQAWNDFLNHRYTDMWFTGGRGCIDGDTLIDTPAGKVKVKDFSGGLVYAYDDKDSSIHVAYADEPCRYKRENLYAVTNALGNSIIVTDEHKFLTPNGWQMLKDLSVGQTIIGCEKQKIVVTSITDIQFKKRDFYWDFNVQGVHNYCAQGFINHNSTKSSFVTMCIVLGMIRDAKEALAHKAAGDKKWMAYLTHAIVYRKIAADLRISVYNQFIWSIEKLGLTDKFKYSVSPLRITYKATGQMIDFRGLDDPIKSKSIKAPFGYYKYNFFEELNQFDGMEEVRNVRQSIMRGGHAFQSFAAFNPPPSSSNWANAESAKIVPGRKVYHSDYRSVPREWLGDTFFQQAEILRLDNERAYRHEYLGEVTGNGGSVFTNIVDRRMTDEEIHSFDNIKWGADWGVNDPNVLMGVHYNRFERSLYVFGEFYKSNALLDQIEAGFRALHFGYSYIYADSASPQMIMEMENRGLPMMTARKFHDSIKHGIHFLRNLRHIYIDQLRCPNCFREMTLYEFGKLKGTELFTDRMPDANNHTIDAIRYSLQEIIEDSLSSF